MLELFSPTDFYEPGIDLRPHQTLFIIEDEQPVQSAEMIAARLPELVTKVCEGDLDFISLRAENGALVQMTMAQYGTVIMEWQHPSSKGPRHFRIINRARLSQLEFQAIECQGLGFTRASAFDEQQATRQLMSFLQEGRPASEAFLFDVTQDIFGDHTSSAHQERESRRYEYIYRNLGAKHPRVMATKTLEGQPELHATAVFMQRAIKEVVSAKGDTQSIEELAQSPLDKGPFGHHGPTLAAMQEQGMSAADLAEITRELQRRTLRSFCELLDGNPDPKQPELEWGLFEVNSNGRPCHRLSGLARYLNQFEER